MNTEMNPGDFITRHSIKGSGADEYPGLTEQGVELARKRAHGIIEDLNSTEPGTVLFIGGASELPRTKSTAAIYGQEMRGLVAREGRTDIMVLTPLDFAESDSVTGSVQSIVGRIQANPDKKIVLDFPLRMGGLQDRNRWSDENGNLSEYTNELLRRNDNDKDASMLDWFDNKGHIDGIKGPDPAVVAQQMLAEINRLREFAKQFIPDRPIAIGAVGHSWDLDALAVYLANNGEISSETYENMKGNPIGETQAVRIITGEGNRQFLEYGKILIPLDNQIESEQAQDVHQTIQ